MKGLPVDRHKGKQETQASDEDKRKHKKRKIAKSIGQKHQHTAAKQNQKLPGRNRPKNFILNINELWHNELLRMGEKLGIRILQRQHLIQRHDIMKF